MFYSQSKSRLIRARQLSAHATGCVWVPARGHLTRQKSINGFQTGDMVCAKVITGKKAGIHNGRVAVRVSGSFNIQTAAGVVQGISHRYCRLIQRADGYGYSTVATRKEMREQVSHKARNSSRSALYLTALKGSVSCAI